MNAKKLLTSVVCLLAALLLLGSPVLSAQTEDEAQWEEQDAAFLQALGDKAGIRRYGDCILPMDEALILSAVDISGRAHISYEADIPSCKVGTFDTELAEEFWTAFVRAAKITLHIRQLAGRNSHHIIEGQFKSVARSLRSAASVDPELAGEIPSTKGVL